MQDAVVVSTGAGGAGLVGIAQILGGSTEIHVKQKIPKLEACSGGCCEVKNTYIITAGNDGNGQQLLEAGDVPLKPPESRGEKRREEERW